MVKGVGILNPHSFQSYLVFCHSNQFKITVMVRKVIVESLIQVQYNIDQQTVSKKYKKSAKNIIRLQ